LQEQRFAGGGVEFGRWLRRLEDGQKRTGGDEGEGGDPRTAAEEGEQRKGSRGGGGFGAGEREQLSQEETGDQSEAGQQERFTHAQREWRGLPASL
jgi:hypothetical protein